MIRPFLVDRLETAFVIAGVFLIAVMLTVAL